MSEPYALDPEHDAPDLPGPVTVRPTLDELLDPLAADLYLHAVTCVRTFGDFHIAFSVGEPQLKVAMRLMVDPAFRELPWSRTHLWIAHDAAPRSVPGRPLMAELLEILGDHAGIPPRHVHPVPDDPDPASAYEREIQQTLAWRERGHDRLDYALLALGGDGRLLGMPDDGVPDEGGRLVVARGAGAGASASMTARLLSATRLIALLAIGSPARPTIARIASGDTSEINAFRPVGGALRWYLDAASAGRTPRPEPA